MPVFIENVLRVEDSCGLTYFLGTLKPEEIKQLTFVPVVTKSSISEDSSEYLNEISGGYQRSGEPGRMDKIKQFIMQRPSCVIPPVLLCARGNWEFKAQGKNPSFGTIEAKELAAIIDGQHRLGGIWRLVSDSAASKELKMRPIPFMAIEYMSQEDEKREFVDVNDNQKGVKKSLLRWLELGETFSGQAATALMEDEESVFKDRIDVQKKHDWTLLLYGAMVECVELMFNRTFTNPKNFDPEKNPDLRESALEFTLNYWKMVAQCMPEFWGDIDLMPSIEQKKTKTKPGTKAFKYRLLEETGIRAFSKLGSELFLSTWIPAMKAPAWEVIEKYLKAMSSRENVKIVLTKPNKENPHVKAFDPDLKSSGKAGVDAIFRHLRSELEEVKNDFNS